MTRKEQIKQAAHKISSRECDQLFFACGAKWADKHSVNLIHDLQKNPKDLPEDNINVIGYYYSGNPRPTIKDAKVYHSHGYWYWYDSIFGIMCADDIIGWTKIPEFSKS